MVKGKNEAGRPRIPIDWKEVDKYLMAGASGQQIAAFLGIHRDTLYDRCVEEKKKYFSEYSGEKKQKGNTMLHYKQFQAAMNGNLSMLIWLGKQRLEQKEDPQGTKGFDGTLLEFLEALKALKQNNQPRVIENEEKKQISADKVD